MLLLIDIGNTSTSVGFCDIRKIEDVFRVETVKVMEGHEKLSEIINRFMQKHGIKKPKGAVICSVVPKTIQPVRKALKKTFNINPLRVNHKIKTGLKFMIKNVERLGADRIADAVAAHRLYKGNLLVIDFGTATTFSYISAKGEFRGGAIMPGIGLSVNVLADRTAKLPRVGLKKPAKAIGRDTAENILSGVIFGHAGAVERIIKETKREGRRDLKTVATGGYVEMIAPYVQLNHINRMLTLEGLRFIHELNSQEFDITC